MPASNEAVLWYCPDSAMSAAAVSGTRKSCRVFLLMRNSFLSLRSKTYGCIVR